MALNSRQDDATSRTDEENRILSKLHSGALDGPFGKALPDNGYGSSLWFVIKNGVPMQMKCGPGGRFFNGKENETWESTPRVDIKWRTDERQLFFFQKYGWLSDDPDIRAYSAKFKGKV